MVDNTGMGILHTAAQILKEIENRRLYENFPEHCTFYRSRHRKGRNLHTITLFIRSFKSLGPFELMAGQGRLIISALEAVIGQDGLILMPTFSLLPSREERVASWDVATTPSTVGWLTEFFRQMPGTYRSDHYSHAVAARGKDAEIFVADHLRREGYQSPWDHHPWGKTYGTHSPMFRAYKANAKLLMIGVDYQTSTYIHLVEVIHWNKRLADDAQAQFIGLNRPALGEFWEGAGSVAARSGGGFGLSVVPH